MIGICDFPLCQALCKHPSVDLNLGGNRGVTAMHIAAYKDQDTCAKILVCMRLQNGTNEDYQYMKM